MKASNKSRAINLLLACLFFLAAAMSATAQEEPSSPQTPARDEQAPPRPVNQQDEQVQAPQDEYSSNLSVEHPATNLATGAVLTTTRSPFRWGNLSVLSIDALQVFDSNYLFLKNNPVPVHAGAVRGLFVYAIKTGRSNWSLQYRPQLWASGDDTQIDYASHMVDFHTFRYLSSQWAINISDQFASVPDRGRLEQIGFSSDYNSSVTTKNPFLSTGRRLLTNSIGI